VIEEPFAECSGVGDERFGEFAGLGCNDGPPNDVARVDVDDHEQLVVGAALGARSQYCSERNTDSTCRRSGSVSLFGGAGRDAGGPNTGGRWRRKTAALLEPSSSYPLFVEVSASRAGRCSAVTASTWSRCPHSRRAAPRACTFPVITNAVCVLRSSRANRSFWRRGAGRSLRLPDLLSTHVPERRSWQARTGSTRRGDVLDRAVLAVRTVRSGCHRLRAQNGRTLRSRLSRPTSQGATTSTSTEIRPDHGICASIHAKIRSARYPVR
jgi:hypothetical protein